MTRAGQDYYLKAMNCPMHNLVFRSRGRSYRELPLRFFEMGHDYRYEKSGVVHGLTRMRGFTQDDSHTYCTPEQAKGEIEMLLNFFLDILRDFGLTDFYLELSTRDEGKKKDKFIGSDEDWAAATRILEEACAATGLDLVPDPGGAAFYGPKVSVQVKDALGRTWQMSTVQYDFNQPERFDLEYTAPDGSRRRPVMIHSAKLGSVERFIGVLTEHYAGAFPPRSRRGSSPLRRPSTSTAKKSRPSSEPRESGSTSICPTTVSARKSAMRPRRRSHSPSSPAERTRRRRPFPSVTATGIRRTAFPWTRRWPTSAASSPSGSTTRLASVWLRSPGEGKNRAKARRASRPKAGPVPRARPGEGVDD